MGEHGDTGARRLGLVPVVVTVACAGLVVLPTTAGQRLFTVAIVLLAGTGLAHAWRTRTAVVPEGRGSLSVMLPAVALLSAPLPLLGPRLATGLAMTTAVGATVLLHGLWRAFRLGDASRLDLLDAALLGVAAAYLSWVHVVSALEDWRLQAVLLTGAALAGGYASLIVLSAREERVPSVRLWTTAGLMLGTIGIQALARPGQTGHLGLGLLVIATGILVSVIRMPWSSDRTADAGATRDLVWWGPLGTMVGTLVTHELLQVNPASEGLVRSLLQMAGAVVMLARVILTVRGLSSVSDQLRADRERYRRLSLTDPLTGLANRLALTERLPALLQQAGTDAPVSVLFCDLDRLKVVNDALGHQVGDQLIAAVAERWSGVMDDHSWIARVGGDEFVVCTTGADPEALATAMHGALRATIVIGGARLTCRTAIGIATSRRRGADAADLLRDADAAMYRAKAEGGDATRLFDETIRAQVLRRLEIEHHLTDAMSAGDIRVHLQPIIDLRSGAVASVEALLRWDHPTLGQVDPEEVVLVAEETGFIIPLGELVLEESLRGLRQLRDRGLRVPSVAVNTSVSQLATLRHVEVVAEALRRHDLPAGALTLEVTESVLLDTGSAATLTLEALAAAGVQLSMDDFGTGYSSLSYLGRVDVDSLKLDSSFLGPLDAPVSAVVLDGVLRIADGLGLSVVAEGVEHAEQVVRLRALGCDMAQGWYFSPALPAVELAGWLQDRETRSGSRAEIDVRTIQAAPDGMVG